MADIKIKGRDVPSNKKVVDFKWTDHLKEQNDCLVAHFVKNPFLTPKEFDHIRSELKNIQRKNKQPGNFNFSKIQTWFHSSKLYFRNRNSKQIKQTKRFGDLDFRVSQKKNLFENS